MLASCKMVKKQSEAFHRFLWHFFPNLKQNFIAYRSSKVSSRPDCIFEIHQLWLSGFSRVYSNFCCSCSFEPEIIEIGQLSHKVYSNNIVNFQESPTILNACTKDSGYLLKAPCNFKTLLKPSNDLIFYAFWFIINFSSLFLLKLFFFFQISSEEINQHSLKWRYYQILKVIILLVLVWQGIV